MALGLGTPGTDRAAARIEHISLRDFRCIEAADLSLAPGLTVLAGANGQGKTSVLEAVGFAARGRSFRGVADAALVRAGSEVAIVRAEVASGERVQSFEAEIRPAARNRILVNKHALARTRDLTELLRVTVFAPDDLALVKEGPGGRRDYLDELLCMLAARYDAARADLDRVLRHRNALLRAGAREESARATLAVFDDQLVAAASELVRGRLRLVERLGPMVDAAYRALAPSSRLVTASYEADWTEEPLVAADAERVGELLRTALARRARAEVERGVTLVGPHRDELRLRIDGFDARTHASQGEQRTLALALRLAGHAVVTDLTTGPPVLLLDDVFSELDPQRAAALVAHLPPGQTLLTTAGDLPRGVVAEQRFEVGAGRVVPA